MIRTSFGQAAMILALAFVVPACADDDLTGLFPPAQPPPGGPEFTAAPGGLRRLLARQYVSSIRLLLGDAAAQAASPPADASLHGFDSIAATELSLSATTVSAFETSTRAVAAAAVSNPATLATIVPCAPTGPTDASCHRQFVTSFGRLAWRRGLDTTEVDRIVSIAQSAATEYSDFNAGVMYAISALLQSPNFLYMVEIGEPDPDFPQLRRLTKYELVTRMSFFLVDHTPDASLLDFVDANDLDAEKVKALARGLLQHPEARVALSNFYGEILRIRDIEDISKNATLFPQFDVTLAQAMKEETLRLIDDVVWERDADVRELLDIDYTFVNQDLAQLYGVPAPAGSGFAKVTLPADQMRSGILSTTAFLSRFAHPDQTSPTRRGRFVRETILCEPISPPPPGVVAVLPAPEPANPQTLRKRLEKHMTDQTCAGCHSLMDTVGFALENYDAIGAFRTMDSGFPIDSSVSDVPGLGTFASAKDLGQILRDDPRVSLCIVKNLLRSSLGHLETPGELSAIEELDASFGESGYQMTKLLVELTASPAFRYVGDPK